MGWLCRGARCRPELSGGHGAPPRQPEARHMQRGLLLEVSVPSERVSPCPTAGAPGSSHGLCRSEMTQPPPDAVLKGEGPSAGTYQVLVVEKVHHAGRPVAHGDEVGGRPVQAQQAQGRALLHAVHAVPAGTRCGAGAGVSASSPRTPPPPPSLLPGRVSSERQKEPGGPGNQHRALPSLPSGPQFLHLQNGLQLRNNMES